MFVLQIQVNLQIRQLECIIFIPFLFFKCIMYSELGAFSGILFTITWTVCISRFLTAKVFFIDFIDHKVHERRF